MNEAGIHLRELTAAQDAGQYVSPEAFDKVDDEIKDALMETAQGVAEALCVIQ